MKETYLMKKESEKKKWKVCQCITIKGIYCFIKDYR